MFSLKKPVLILMLLVPIFASAQAPGPFGTMLSTVQSIIAFLIPLLISIAVLVFFWGLVKYIANASDESAKESGKSLMVWGMIALFVMVSFWGIIGYVQSSFGISGAVTFTPAPTVTFGS